jgi:hypothetical protein
VPTHQLVVVDAALRGRDRRWQIGTTYHLGHLEGL